MTAIPVDRVHYPDQHSFKVMDSKFVTDTHFTFVKTLGSGAYGVVIAANDSRDRKKVAIKKISRAFENATDGLRTLREIKLLQHFNHPNIVKMKDIINPPRGVKLDDIYLVQDLMPSDLRKVIFSKQTLSEDHTRYFIYQLLLAVKHIHSAGVIHRDLKPGNLLINEDCLLKVCDFGLARGFGKISDFKEDMTEYVVTRWYRAPEILTSCSRYGFEVDTWSIGCIMAELIARKPLFPGESSMHQLKLIVTLLGLSSTDDLKWMDNPKAVEHVLSLGVIPKASLKKLFPNTCSAGVDLLTSMLEFNPSKRISIKNALSHPFFSEFHGTQQAPDASSLFDFEFDKIQHSKQTLQDFVWEEIYKFRPFLRPLGPNLTDQHYTVMRERMARKKLAKEELHKKQQLKIAADRLKELKPAGLTIAVPSELKRVPSIVAVPPGVTLPPIVAVQSASVSVSAISSDDGTIALPGQLSGYISHSTQSVVGAPLDAQTVKPSGYISYSSTGGATAPPAKKKDQHKETDAEVANINMPSAI